MKRRKRKRLVGDKIDFRIMIIIFITVIFFLCIILRILYLNLFMGNYYDMKLNKEKDIYTYGQSVPRGRILDRNGKVLVDNKSVKSIVYKKPYGVTVSDEVKMAYKISKILKLDYDKLTLRNKKEFFTLINDDIVSKLITDDEYEKLQNRKLTEQDIYELKIERITKKMLGTMTKGDIHAAYLYYLMNSGYFYDQKIIKGSGVSDKEYAYFSENSKSLNGFSTSVTWERVYPYGDVLRTILGRVSSSDSGIPKEDASFYLSKGYSLNDRVGISGLEKQYESVLKGEKDVYRVANDNKLKLVKRGSKGKDVKISIDIDLQIAIDKMLSYELVNAKGEANTGFFNKSYVVITNPYTGEIMSISGKVLSDNNRHLTIDNPEGVFLSTVTPGSVVKGASIMVGYTTGVIKIGDYMEDSCIKLYNLPSKCSWKTLGYINDLSALAFSSNVYQYKIAMKVGGFDYSWGKRLKINENAFDTYRNMFYRFGLGVKTGIDFPKEEDGYKSDNRAGDLLINYAIGQYDTYTTLQLNQYVSTIANRGTRYKTHFLKSVLDDNGDILYEARPIALNRLDVSKKYINRVRKGFRLVTTIGTGVGYMDKAPTPSGKTGTSESFVDLDGDNVIDAESISNNFVGYAPSSKPVMAIAASFPDIQNPNGGEYKSNVNQRVVSKSADIFFKLYDSAGNKKIKKSKKSIA